jgi:peptidoglycan/LPS O-acetylase OafA/YrhL
VTVSQAGFRYRPEIDALRGVAVLAVLVFHLNPHWLAGGFVGVDIFFVISGYVVTGSLLNHAHEPLPRRLGGFYLRRVRRLLPNLFACIGVTALATALLVPPRETRGLFTTGVKSLFGWSNNHLVGASKDYFGLDAALNPFVHTWSLGVEEQFYLVFPLLLVLCGFGARRTLPLLLAGIVLSLSLSLWWTVEAPISAFFLMPSRFWELAAGAALLLAQRRRFAAGWASGPRVQLLGGALLLAALLFTPERQAFPAPAALPAVLGTLLLLQFRPGPDGHFLPLRWLERGLVACGLLSYSLYLWHWPVVTFLRWTYGLERPWQYLLATGLSFALAWLAYRWIEQPVRRHPLPPPQQWGLAALAFVLTWLGTDALAHPLRGRLFQGSTADPVPRQEDIAELRPVIAGTGITDARCGVATWAPYSISNRTDFGPCSKPGRAGAGEIFLLGDSHAHHLLPMLDRVTDRTGQAISFSFKNSCLISPDLTISFQKKRYEPCRQFAAGELDRALERLRPGDIVMVSTWLNRQLGDIDSRGQANDFPVWAGARPLTPSQVRDAYVDSSRRIAQRLAARGIQLVLVVDVPMLAREPVVCASWARLQSASDRDTVCSPAATTTASMQNTVRRTLARVASGLGNVHVFDPTDLLLVDGQVRYRHPDGSLLYSDQHHLSRSGSSRLAEPFQRFLEREGLVPAPVASQPRPPR